MNKRQRIKHYGLLCCGVLLLALLCLAQVYVPSIIVSATGPTGSCANSGPLFFNYTTPALYGCSSSTWTALAGGGAGGITQLTGNVTAGPGSGSQAATIANNVVTPAMLTNPNTPGWLRWLGDGSNGAQSCSSTLAPGEYWDSSFTVSNGNTCTVSSTGPLIVRSTGVCTLAGTLTSTGTNTSALGDFGGSGGGGGFGAANGTAGNGISYGINPNAAITAGGSAGTSGVSGGGGASPTASRGLLFYSLPAAYARGGGSGGAGGSSGGAGGAGGGVIVLVCASINFSGTVSAAGSAGGAGGSNTGGGGGGGGGLVVMSTPTYTANTGTISVGGGTAGSIGTGTSTAGGAGGAGVSKQFTIQ